MASETMPARTTALMSKPTPLSRRHAGLSRCPPSALKLIPYILLHLSIYQPKNGISLFAHQDYSKPKTNFHPIDDQYSQPIIANVALHDSGWEIELSKSLIGSYKSPPFFSETE
jgi:hypothetical protein